MLGDFIESALDRIGINKERVERWLGHPCGCQERQDKLNAISSWARRVSQGATDKALDFLNRIVNSGS